VFGHDPTGNSGHIPSGIVFILENMSSTSSRTLRLLSLFQAHRYWSGADLADRLNVSERTLRRDVDRLRELGYPVEAHRGIDGGYELAAGAALPPLAVDDDEAVALVIGLRTAAQGSVAGIEESAIRALTKIVQVMPPRLRRRVDALSAVTVPAVWGGGPSVDAGVLTTIAQACRDEERMRFSYTGQTGEVTNRHVEPHRLVSLGQRWYLVAFDLTRHDWRSFRLDRLEGPRGTGARFRPRDLPAQNAAAFVRDGIESAPAVHTVEAVVHAPAGTVRAALGQWATIEEIDDERCRLRMTADSLNWPALALGSVGAEFEVVGPPELAEHIREWGTRFRRATSR
jgi:predicted DNA-binding transcriptional regulator YafY